MIILDGSRAFESDRFSYNPVTGTLVAEDSTLRGPLNSRLGLSLCHPIYDDACDEGIAIRSVKTGRVVRFYLSHIDKDREGDTAGWNFKPISEDARWVPVDLSVLIIND